MNRNRKYTAAKVNAGDTSKTERERLNNTVFNDENISLAAIGVFAIICGLKDKGQKITFSALQAACPKDTPEALRAALHELEAGGYIDALKQITEESGEN